LRTKLIPLAAVITPNLPEAAALLDEPVAASEGRDREPGQAVAGAGMCRGADSRAATGRPESTDYLIDAKVAIALAAPRRRHQNTTAPAARLSSAIAAGLARGESMEAAVRTPRPGSAPRSHRRTASASAMGTARSIIFTVFTDALTFLRRPAVSLGAGAAHQHGPLGVAQAVGLEEGFDGLLVIDDGDARVQRAPQANGQSPRRRTRGPADPRCRETDTASRDSVQAPLT